MTPKELAFIKNVQRQFKEEFGRDLSVDFPAMNGAINSFIPRKIRHDTVSEYLKTACKRHKVSIEDVRRRYNGPIGNREIGRKVKAVLSDFCKFVALNKYDSTEAATLINRDRSLIYFYKNY